MWMLAAIVLMGGATARAANPPAPTSDEDFLAYLGSWEGDDADWQVVQSTLGTERARSAAPPQVKQQQPRPTTAEGTARTVQEQKQ